MSFKLWREIPNYSDYECTRDGDFRYKKSKQEVPVRERIRTKKDAPKRYVVTIEDNRGTTRTLDTFWLITQTFPTMETIESD